MAARPSPRARRIVLKMVLVVAAIDGVALIALLSVAFAGGSDSVFAASRAVYVLGYVYLVYLTGTGAIRGLWAWWFPALVFVTGGPIGALLGGWRLRREPVPEVTTEAPARRGRSRRSGRRRRGRPPR